MIILGIDPGLLSTGLGVIDSENGVSRLLGTETVRTRPNHPLPERLNRIHQGVSAAVARWAPEVVAVESLFFAKNVRTAVLLAHARSAAILGASGGGIQVVEYSPLEIKQAVAGYGRAGKEQIQRMVEVILRPPEPLENEHISDALACALCHAHRQGRPSMATGTASGCGEELPPAKRLLSLARKGRRRRRR